MRTVLGIDPSLTATGLAVVTGGQLISAGVIYGGDFRGAERLAHISDGVTEWLQRLPHFDVSVAIENYAFGSVYGREVMGEVGGVIRLAVWRFGLTYLELAPASWQSQLLGKPVAKLLRGAQLMQRYPDVVNQTEFDTFDALEAFAIALAGWQRAEGIFTAPAPKVKKRKGRKAAQLDMSELIPKSSQCS